MTPTRRRSVLVGLGLGLLLSLGLGYALASCGDDDQEVDATLTEPGGGPEPGLGNADASGQEVPDLAFEKADGSEVRLSDYAGKPLVVNLWSSTCAPCIKEMPAFEAVHQQVGDRITFVGVNNGDSAETMVEFAEKTGVTYDVVRDPKSRLSAELGIALLPATFYVSADGEIVAQKTGALSAENLRATLDELFPP
jgi:thiol-disulfide isomerase/thioredoxin